MQNILSGSQGRVADPGGFYPVLDPTFPNKPGPDPALDRQTERHTDKHAKREREKKENKSYVQMIIVI